MKFFFIVATLTLSKSAFAFPQLYFSDAQPYDALCVNGFDYSNIDKQAKSSKINDEWLKEVRSRIGEFQNQWDSVAPQLFNILVSKFKHEFKRKEYSVALSICPDSPSMPKPLVLNISRYLKSYMSPKQPKEMVQFIDVVFHELLHLWLFENFNQESIIKKKYKNHGESVINHIHLFAIESFVLEKAGFSEVWKNTKEFINKKGGPHLKALTIMEKEGRDKVLQEIN